MFYTYIKMAACFAWEGWGVICSFLNNYFLIPKKRALALVLVGNSHKVPMQNRHVYLQRGVLKSKVPINFFYLFFDCLFMLTDVSAVQALPLLILSFVVSEKTWQ